MADPRRAKRGHGARGICHTAGNGRRVRASGCGKPALRRGGRAEVGAKAQRVRKDLMRQADLDVSARTLMASAQLISPVFR